MWFRVDDKLWGSPKWTSLRPGPRALWVTAGSYSMDQLTDGFIPTHVIPILGGRESDAVALVKAGMWENEVGGFRFHDWSDWQPSREDVLGKREAEAARKAEWRAKRAAQRAASASGPEGVPNVSQRDNGVSPEVVPDVSRSSRPDPTRPDPTTPKGVVEGKTRPPAARPDTFDAWWTAYKRKEAKGKAIPAYRAALRKITADELLRLTVKWFDDRPDVEATYYPLPASWLNAERWTDDKPPTRLAVAGAPRPIDHDQWMRR